MSTPCVQNSGLGTVREDISIVVRHLVSGNLLEQSQETNKPTLPKAQIPLCCISMNEQSVCLEEVQDEEQKVLLHDLPFLGHPAGMVLAWKEEVGN